MDSQELANLKIMIREADYPLFSDEELDYYYNECGNDLRKTAYRCLIIKSENTSLQVSGLSTGNSSDYFKRLAHQYKPNNSGILKGGV